jgi:hypothetical protein
MDLLHLHLLLNHVPVIGTFFGIALLLAALVRRSRELVVASLALFVLNAAVAVPVYLTGEPAEDRVEKLPGVSAAVIERHEEAAAVGFGAVAVLGAVSLVGLALAARNKPVSRGLMAVPLVLAVVAAGLMAWTANLGGQVRHTEIRAANGR